ncbi:hypothetical protein Tcan_05468 [Toxocara canis]|uniref:BTB domain-containing protein n=1 Tax=Toxocara canis TaxID=6265 RepID=A0A0B2UVV5_TOXCA|nr:hypothetical protein Tcan_05468 [Toxocara canis]
MAGRDFEFATTANFLAAFRFERMPYEPTPSNCLEADFRISHGKRTFIIMIENDIPLFVDPELFAYQSRDFRENYEKAVAAGRNEVRYDEINEYTMTTLLESVCPAVYNTYPRPPSVLEVANLSLCAYRLKMDNFLKVCERILKEDWAPWKTWPAQLLANFNAAYRCRMCIDLQARLLSAVICNPLYGYNTENEMFFSPTANVFLRALVQHRSGCLQHYGPEALDGINPEIQGGCRECAKRRMGCSRRQRNRHTRSRSRCLFICRECSTLLCANCGRLPCIVKVTSFLSKCQLPQP